MSRILLLIPLAVLLLAPRSAAAEDCWDTARPFAAAGDWARVEHTLRDRDDRDRACDLLLAEALVHQGKHTWAIQLLRPIIAADPASGAARTILGAAILGLGDHEGLLAAANELPPTAPEDPWTGVLEHQRAAAEFRVGEDRAARLRLARLLRERPLHPYRDEADRYLDLTWLYRYGDRPRAQFNASAGIQYDSNAAFEPDQARASVIEGDPAAWRGWLSASGRVPLLRGARTVVAANATAYRSFHSTAISNDFNYTDFSGGATLTHRMLWGQTDAALDLAWQSRIGLLDGGPLLPEPRVFAFLENHSLAAGFHLEPAEGLLVGLTGVGGYQQFAELPRNNWAGGGLLSILWTVGPADLVLSGSGLYREATGDGYDRYELTARLNLEFRLPWEVRVGGSGGFGYDDYLDSADWFEQGPRRVDTRWDVRLTLGRPIAAGFGLGLQGGYAQRLSTVGTFGYDHWTAGVELTWGYPWQ